MVTFLMELSLGRLVVKEGVEDTAREVFHDSDIHNTIDGHRYLGGVIGSEAFEQHFFYSRRCKIGFLTSRN